MYKTTIKHLRHQMNKFLTEKEELEIVLALSSKEVREQREREQKERDLAADEAFARALEQSSKEVHEHRARNAPSTNGLSPQEAAAFAAYARRDTYNNYRKKK